MNKHIDNNPDRKSSLESKMLDIIIKLKEIIDQHEIVNPEPIREIISEFQKKIRDVAAVEQNMNSVRREIISPVKVELERSSKLGKFSYWGFLVGIIAFVLAIATLFYNIYFTNKSINQMEEYSKRIAKLYSLVDSYVSTSKKYSNSYQDSLNSIIFKGEPYTNSETIKPGETFRDLLTKAELVVTKISKDNTASITTNFPVKSKYGLPGEYTNILNYHDKVSIGKFWDYESLFGKYKITIININSSNNTVALKINEIESAFSNITSTMTPSFTFPKQEK